MTQYAAAKTADIDPDALVATLECSAQRAKVVRLKIPQSPDNQRKEETRYTKWCSEFLWLREWDLNLTTFGL